MSHKKAQKAQRKLATKTPRHKGNLIADYADDSDLIGHKKAQKTQRKLATKAARHEGKLATDEHSLTRIFYR